MPVRVVLRQPKLKSRSPDPESPVASPRTRSIRRTTEHLVLSSRPGGFGAEDISASTRLSGYLFIFTAYCVLFVSTVKFNQLDVDEDKNAAADADAGIQELDEWKLKFTLYGSLTFMAIIVFIVALHFEAFLCLNLWRKVFKDGSYGECAVLICLMLFALAMTFVTTSTTGLGGHAGLNYNVFFSSWAGLAACFHTFNLWLVSTGASSIGDTLRKSNATDYDWTWTLFYSVIIFLSLMDLLLEYGGVEMLRHRSSLIMLISSSCSAGCCVISLIMNRIFPAHNCHWYILEGIILLALCSFWTWVVFRFTGINGFVNGPSNSYIGVWGCFYHSISTFGIWIKERRRLVDS